MPGTFIKQQTFQAVLQIASSLTLAEASSLLWILDDAHMERTVYSDYAETYPVCFEELGDDFDALKMPCSTLGPIWFEGGVPGRRDWVCALVSQFVADCILLTMVERGEKKVLAILKQQVSVGAP